MLELTSRSSTSTLECWASDQETWRGKVRFNEFPKTTVQNMMHPQFMQNLKVVIRLKGPRSSNHPHGWLSVVRWITCTFEPHQSNQKKVTTPGRHVPACNIFHVANCDKLNSFSGITGKRRLSQLKSTNPRSSCKTMSPQHSGQLFNTTTGDRWNYEKRPAVSLYLNELLGWKL